MITIRCFFDFEMRWRRRHTSHFYGPYSFILIPVPQETQELPDYIYWTTFECLPQSMRRHSPLYYYFFFLKAIIRVAEECVLFIFGGDGGREGNVVLFKFLLFG